MASGRASGGVQFTQDPAQSEATRGVNGTGRAAGGGHTRTHNTSKTASTLTPTPTPITGSSSGMTQRAGLATVSVNSADPRQLEAGSGSGRTPARQEHGHRAGETKQQQKDIITDRLSHSHRHANKDVAGTGNTNTQPLKGGAGDAKNTNKFLITGPASTNTESVETSGITKDVQTGGGDSVTTSLIQGTTSGHVQNIVKSLQNAGLTTQVLGGHPKGFQSRDNDTTTYSVVSDSHGSTRKLVTENSSSASSVKGHNSYQSEPSLIISKNNSLPVSDNSLVKETGKVKSDRDQNKFGTHRTLINVIGTIKRGGSSKRKADDDTGGLGLRVERTRSRIERRSRRDKGKDSGAKMEIYDMGNEDDSRETVKGKSDVEDKTCPISAHTSRPTDGTHVTVDTAPVSTKQSVVADSLKKQTKPTKTPLSTKQPGVHSREGLGTTLPAKISKSESHIHNGAVPVADGGKQTKDDLAVQNALQHFESVINSLSHSSAVSGTDEPSCPSESEESSVSQPVSTSLSHSSDHSHGKVTVISDSTSAGQQQQQQQPERNERPLPMPPPRKGRTNPPAVLQPVTSTTGTESSTQSGSVAKDRRPLSSPPGVLLTFTTTSSSPPSPPPSSSPSADHSQQQQREKSPPPPPAKPQKQQQQQPRQQQLPQAHLPQQQQKSQEQQQQQQQQQSQVQPQQQPQQQQKQQHPQPQPQQQETEQRPLTCYNHADTEPHRYCSDHNHSVCLECAFEFHRSCSDVDLIANAARARRGELEGLCEHLLFRKAEWECALDQIQKSKTRLAEEKERTLTSIQELTEQAVKAMQEKGEVLRQEAESMFQTEEAESATKEEKLRHAVGLAQQVYSQGEEVLGGRGEAAILKQFGKLKERCEEILDTDIAQSPDALERIRVTSTWPDDVRVVKLAELTVERKPVVKKTPQLSERGLQTLRRIWKRKRDTVSPDIYQEKVLAPPPVRSGPRSSLSRSIASTGSLGSFSMSNQSMGFLDGPQSLFEFWAGLESDKYPFGLGDICVLQPRATILITYLTSDLLRVFPWRQESPPFVSQPLGCTLCCITQLTTELVAVTSSNSDQLSIMKLEKDAISLVHAVSMKKQYRAVTSLDYRTLALATDNKKSHNNAITIVRFDSSDFRSYTHLKTISGRVGSFPRIRLLSRTLFKVPYSMCVSSHSHIIVSDSENKALLALGPDGEQRFVFQPPKHSRVIDTPGGVACSPSGFLYLVDSCEQRILRFNSRGKFLKVVLSQEDGLEWPIAVACVDDSTLCVAEFYGQVKVFQVR